jgi:hypothetical protein
MVAAGEIVPVRLRGWSVRFYVPDVVEALRNEKRKWGRRAVWGRPKAEIRNPKVLPDGHQIRNSRGVV